MPRPPSGNIRVNFYIDPRVLAALRKLARRRGTTYSDLIRMATNAYVISELRTLPAVAPVSPGQVPDKCVNAMLSPQLGRLK